MNNAHGSLTPSAYKCSLSQVQSIHIKLKLSKVKTIRKLKIFSQDTFFFVIIASTATHESHQPINHAETLLHYRVPSFETSFSTSSFSFDIR